MSRFFDISKFTISTIFITWINHLWEMLYLWPFWKKDLKSVIPLQESLWIVQEYLSSEQKIQLYIKQFGLHTKNGLLNNLNHKICILLKIKWSSLRWAFSKTCYCWNTDVDLKIEVKPIVKWFKSLQLKGVTIFFIHLTLKHIIQKKR